MKREIVECDVCGVNSLQVKSDGGQILSVQIDKHKPVDVCPKCWSEGSLAEVSKAAERLAALPSVTIDNYREPNFAEQQQAAKRARWTNPNVADVFPEFAKK